MRPSTQGCSGPEPLPDRCLLTEFLDRIIYRISRPHQRGAFDQRRQTWGGERWPGRGVGDATQTPFRRSKPLVSGAPAARRKAHLTAGRCRPVRGRQRQGQGLSTVECCGLVEGYHVTNGRPPRSKRSKPINTARGTPGRRRTCGTTMLRQASMSRGVEARGSSGPKAFRAPSSFEGAKRKALWTTACPGPIKNTGDDACLRLIPCRRRRGIRKRLLVIKAVA
jgi:hypothetical protein